MQTLSKSTNCQAINSLVNALLNYINYGLNYIQYITYSVYVCTCVFYHFEHCSTISKRELLAAHTLCSRNGEVRWEHLLHVAVVGLAEYGHLGLTAASKIPLRYPSELVSGFTCRKNRQGKLHLLLRISGED